MEVSSRARATTRWNVCMRVPMSCVWFWCAASKDAISSGRASQRVQRGAKIWYCRNQLSLHPKWFPFLLDPSYLTCTERQPHPTTLYQWYLTGCSSAALWLRRGCQGVSVTYMDNVIFFWICAAGITSDGQLTIFFLCIHSSSCTCTPVATSWRSSKEGTLLLKNGGNRWGSLMNACIHQNTYVCSRMWCLLVLICTILISAAVPLITISFLL